MTFTLKDCIKYQIQVLEGLGWVDREIRDTEDEAIETATDYYSYRDFYKSEIRIVPIFAPTPKTLEEILDERKRLEDV